jgi:glycosyltransferase involved in cell wall biosynthesis
MPKVDMHVHSRYSEHPSEWFLQRIGAAESYTDPEFIYKEAKDKGMAFVTITDHNTIGGSFLLNAKYPADTFTGVEVTTYFPEDGCKIHILLYGITEDEFARVQKLRSNIYALREYVKENRIAYSVAHASYSVNGKLTISHLEKLILLFDVFESINGARDNASNSAWTAILRNLNPAYVGSLCSKYKIDPISSDPWIKGFTGGSDDHAGIFIGRTFTTAEEAYNPSQFVARLRDKKTLAGGRNNDFKGLAFAIYKIAYDFSKRKGTGASSSLLSQITEYIFEKKKLNLKNNLKVSKVRLFGGRDGSTSDIQSLLVDLIDGLSENSELKTEEKLDIVYSKISSIADTFLKNLLVSAEKDLAKGDVASLLKNVSSSITALFLSAPFFTTIKHIYESRATVNKYASQFHELRKKDGKKILWFTDTLNDLNGVSVTLKTMGWLSHRNNKNIKLAACLAREELTGALPPDIMNFPFIHTVKIPYYEKYTLKVPSVLEAIKEIYDYEPDEIMISTPGPVGLLGYLAAKLTGTKCSGIYHTDFASQAMDIVKDESAVGLIESYTQWFYGAMDEIRVPTMEYMEILEKRGFDTSKMTLFKRGIDSALFSPRSGGKIFLKELIGLNEATTLLYTGRVSEDKNLDFLINVYKKLQQDTPDLNLVILGDGPYLSALRAKCRGMERVFLPGKLDQQVLPVVLAGCDIFVFPSNTDTFGMSVLESQSCGLPAVVSDIGGPKEIIVDGVTGFVAAANDMNDWAGKIRGLITMQKIQNPAFKEMQKQSRVNVLANYDWNTVLEAMTTIPPVKTENENDFTDGSRPFLVGSSI